MPKLLYIANIRLPTEKAHALQIMQNCEAFADHGLEVALWIPRRHNTPELRSIRDVWAHYGVKQSFTVRRIPCIDVMPLDGKGGLRTRLLFYVQMLTFTLMMSMSAAFTRAEVYYSRDLVPLLVLSLIKPRQALVYEAHALNRSRLGAWLQRTVLGRISAVVAITPPLRDGLERLQMNNRTQSRLMVAHDGIRKARFENVPSQVEARRSVGWSEEMFVIGYVGRLKTLGMDKGVDTLIDALALLQNSRIALAIVGGPEDLVEQYHQRWLERGLSPDTFLYGGQVSPERVPIYLSAFDVCVMPLPWTEHFAYYASPIKLFEYMASGRALIASDMPAWADVLTDGENALLFPPSDAQALATAISRLHLDPILREKLAANAYECVMREYTWRARTRDIWTFTQNG